MAGKESSDHPDRSGKKKISLVAGRSDFFSQYGFLVTDHGILKENHDTLKKDYEVLEKRFNLEKEVSEALKVHQQKKIKELETKLERFVKDLEKEKGEKEVLKKEMERMESEKENVIKDLRIKNQELLTAKEKELKKMKNRCGELEKKCESEKEEFKKKMEKIENENKATINDLKNKNQKLVIEREKGDEELKKMKNKCGELAKKCESEKAEFKKEMERMEVVINDLKNKNQKLVIAREAFEEELKKRENEYGELTERCGVVETECSYLKSLYDAEKLTVLGGNNVALKKEVIVVGDHNVNNAITDPIMILDDSDAESDNPASKSNKVPQRSVDSKRKQQFDVPNSSKVNHHLQSSSSSSSSSDSFVIVQQPFKRPREYKKS